MLRFLDPKNQRHELYWALSKALTNYERNKYDTDIFLVFRLMSDKTIRKKNNDAALILRAGNPHSKPFL